MQFTTETWMILALTLGLGWLLGLMSRSGGGKWKRELKLEREKHVLELRERDTRLTAADARIAELERQRPVAATTDYRDDPRHRDSALDNLDLTRGRADDHDRTVIRPTRP